MVKTKNIILFIIGFFFLINSCSNSLTGFFYSVDIEERRKVMDNLAFVDSLGPLNIGDGSYSFIVLTDTHLCDGNLNELDRLPKIIENNPEIKFAIVLGDITDTGARIDFLNYIDIAHELSSMGVPFYPVIGNHDIYNNGWKVWKEKIGSTIYRRDSGNATLIILDSANNFYGKKQLDWLENQLKSANRDVFVFSHVPLFATGYVKWVQVTDLNERARMTAMLRNKCKVMFTGHAHTKSVNRAGGVEYISLDAFINDMDYCLVTVTDTELKIEYLNF